MGQHTSPDNQSHALGLVYQNCCKLDQNPVSNTKLTAEMESIANPRASRAIVARVVSLTTSAAVAVILRLLAPILEAGLKATAIPTTKHMSNLNIVTKLKALNVALAMGAPK